MLDVTHPTNEDRLWLAAQAYGNKSFDLLLDFTPWATDGLPYFITEGYLLRRAELFGRDCLFMATQAHASLGDGPEIARHRQIVGQRFDGALVVLLFWSLSSKRRRWLVRERIAFMVPDSQLFIPDALLEFRERQPRTARLIPPERLSPTAQVIVLATLLGAPLDGENVTALARHLGVAAMSISRALDELGVADLAETAPRGRQRILRMRWSDRRLWDAAEARFQTPVRKVRRVIIPCPDHFPGHLAGESALALRTLLSEPLTQRLAVAAADWRRLMREHGLENAEPSEPGASEIETWSYDPGTLSPNKVVDHLSLYLSLRDHRDERVLRAADDLLESMPW